MSSALTLDNSPTRLPTLVQMASIVLNKCAEEQADFGDNVRFDLVKPILELASADLLARVEAACPRIELDTEYIWKAHCTRKFPVLMREYDTDTWEGSAPWKNAFFQCKHEEALRLKQLSSKIRNQRQDLEDRKRDSQVKLTDKVPPTKRARTNGWGQPTAPKTLFQKTRSDASRLQKTLYSRKAPPPRPRPSVSTPSASTMFSSASSSGSSSSSGSVRSTTPLSSASSRSSTASAPSTTGVTVRTVVRRPAPGPSAVPQHIPNPKSTSPSRPLYQSSNSVPGSPSKGSAVRNSSGIPSLSSGAFDRATCNISSPVANDLKKGPAGPPTTSPALARSPARSKKMSSMFMPSKPRAAVKS